MKTFTVTTKVGTTYNVRLLDINISDYYKKLGVNGGYDKDAEIEVNGTWYRCMASNAKDVKTVCINQYSKELRDALNIPASVKSSIHIKADTDWHPLYTELLNENEAKWKQDANNAYFSKIRFTHHSMHKYCNFGWDSELNSAYIEYNAKMDALKAALIYIDPNLLNNYRVSDDYDDYNCWTIFEVPASDIDQIISFAKPGLEKAVEAKKASDIAIAKAQEKRDNIASGCIYLHCESAPHNEDLSKAILNRPCPNGGLFTIDHRIDESLFNRIKKYGSYWDDEWLEECDMFTSSPGWRFSIDAIKELAKTNTIYVDNKIYEL